jgi:hypothetical protein
MNLKECLDTVDRRIESAKIQYPRYSGAATSEGLAFYSLCDAVQLLRKVVEQLGFHHLKDERTIK